MQKECFICEIAKDTYAINEYGMAAMYLLVGTKGALLIDGGCGTLDVQETIKKLTDKPVTMVLTHNHPDHIGAVPQFDRVYVHPEDGKTLFPINWEEIKGYVGAMVQMGVGKVYDVKSEDVRDSDKRPELADLYDGQVFDLGGGREVEVLFTPGHTVGHCCLLDRKRRILFSGDACNINLLLQSNPVSMAMKGLCHIKEHEKEFDQNWNGHIGYAGQPNVFSMPPEVLEDCITICEKILDGTAESEEAFSPFGPAHVRAVTLGKVRVTYDPENIGK